MGEFGVGEGFLARLPRRHIAIIDLQHENAHGGGVNVVFTVIVGAMSKMTVGFLGAADNCLEALVPSPPVFAASTYARCLKTGSVSYTHLTLPTILLV